jgi:sulfur relay (sulfurtransferase) DsrF/TusC family protein
MIELLIIVFVAYTAYNIGVSVTAWRLKDIIIKEARKEGIIVDDEYNIVDTEDNKPKVSKLWIEKVHDILYLYDTEDTFICQASTMEELATLALKYKDIKYASVLNGDDVYAFVNGNVKSSNEILK